jgi:hypothetical protein
VSGLGRTFLEEIMIRKLALPVAIAAGILMAGAPAEARDGCGLGFHRNIYGWCRPNFGYRPFVYAPAHRWHYGYRYGWHRRFAWHRGYRWGGYRHVGWGGRWHGGWHRGWHGGWHHRW